MDDLACLPALRDEGEPGYRMIIAITTGIMIRVWTLFQAK